MAIEIIIDKAHRLVTTRCDGCLTEQELVLALRTYEEDPEMDPEFVRIWDITQVKMVTLSPKTLAAFLTKLLVAHVILPVD